MTNLTLKAFLAAINGKEVHRNYYENFFEAYKGWKEFIDWYNNLRLHRSLNNLSAKQFREKILSTKFS